MPQPSPSWNTKRIFARWRKLSGELEPGSWTLDTTGRIVNRLADGTLQIFRKGRIANGSLNTTIDTAPSIDIELPIIDDPDNSPQGGELILTVTFASGAGSEIYHLSPLSTWQPSGTDLASLLPPDLVPAAPPFNIKGVPGGVAALDNEGYVTNADGTRPSGGGGGGGGGVESWSEITSLPDFPAAAAIGSSQANARAAIGAGTSNLVIGTTSSTAKAGNYVPGWTEVTGKPTSFAPAAHNHAATEITSGALPVTVAPLGSIITLLWDAGTSSWRDKAGTAYTGRVTGRPDICFRFVGGAVANEPAWANSDGDEHLVTS